MLTRTRKEEIVQDLKGALGQEGAIFIVEPRPMPVEVFTGLRVEVRKVGGSVRMVKNTLALRAIEGTDLSVLAPALKGSSVLVMGADSLVLSKAIKKFQKENDNALVYKGGVIDGQSVDFAMVEALADLPSLDELRAQLLGVLSSPASSLVRVLSAMPRAVVNVLSNKVEKGE